MRVVLAVVEARGDWPAWLEAIGLRSWYFASYPCCVCWCPKADLYSVGNIAAHLGEHPDFTDADYDECVAKCKLVSVRVSLIVRAREACLSSDSHIHLEN